MMRDKPHKCEGYGRPRVHVRHPARQQGQSAFEFVFAMLWIIALSAVLYQALHFELDVFNKMGILRYKVFKEARVNQPTTSSRMINQEIQGKDLGDLTFFRVPYQSVDQTLHYGPKSFYVWCGTKSVGGEFITAFEGLAIAGLALDHYEDSSGYFNDGLSTLNSALGPMSGLCS